MALDFYAAPITHESRHVGLGLDSYGELMAAADPIDRYPMLRRLQDYYEDAKFSVGEVTILEAEIRELLPSAEHARLRELVELCTEARNHGLGIEAVAD